VVGQPVAVGGPGYGVRGLALGEGAIWVGGWDRRGGLLSRLDRGSGEVVGTIRVPQGGGEVAAGYGAVWAAGEVCVGPHPDDPADVCLTEPRLSRVDPASGRVAATIVVTLPPGTGRDTALVSAVATGFGAVWMALSWNSTTGEIVRIDPRTNAIVARIPTGGFVGEMRLAAGSVWVLSHASLLRIDPSTNAIAGTPIRGELSLLGGDELPPVLAAGDDAVWVTSPTAAHPRRALRVDTQSGEVSRVRLGVERFYPVAVAGDGVWFIGTGGGGATLARLDPRTLEAADVTPLPIHPVRAVLDPATDTFWIASLINRSSERAQVVSVQVR
jgi:hypothetical protein